MTTNLLATIVVMVTTTTNDIPRWTQQICRDGAYEWIMYTDESKRGIPLVDWQTGKTQNVMRIPSGGIEAPSLGDFSGQRVRVVQTRRVTRLTFEWRGKPHEVVLDEELLEETRTILVRQETWIPKQPNDGSPNRQDDITRALGIQHPESLRP
jgi:hypothetical protein